MKSKVKQEKGVTLIVLVITVIALSILTFTITVNTKNSAEIRRLSQLKSDIANLNQKVSDFYNKYGEIPASIEYTNISGLQEILNNKEKSADSKFYVLNLQAMKGISLNYGQDYENVKGTNTENANNYKDLYIINNLTHNIFYVDGVSVTEDGQSKVYYTSYDVPADVPDIDLSVKYKNVNTSKTNPAEATPDNVIVIEDDATKGITIEDENYNEWVWIEVPKDTVFSGLTIDTTKELTEQNYTDIKNKMIAYVGVYRKGSDTQSFDWTDEWYAKDGNTIISASTANLTDAQKALKNGCGLTYDEYNLLYKNMLKSVYEYGGFWIARYEAGIEESNKSGITEKEMNELARSSYTEISRDSPSPISQKDAIPYNWVTCSEAQQLASRMSPTDKYESSLMFGIQWDLLCKFLEVKGGFSVANINSNSDSWGNYLGTTRTISSDNAKQSTDYTTTWKKITGTKSTGAIVLSTGASNDTCKMNIFDLAGNEWEWTLEKNSYLTSVGVYRGGGYTRAGLPVSYRGILSNMTMITSSDIGFRASFCKNK